MKRRELERLNFRKYMNGINNSTYLEELKTGRQDLYHKYLEKEARDCNPQAPWRCLSYGVVGVTTTPYDPPPPTGGTCKHYI